MIEKYNWDLDDWKKWCNEPSVEQYKYCFVVAFQDNTDIISISLFKTDNKNMNWPKQISQDCRYSCVAHKRFCLRPIITKGSEFCKKFFDNELDKMEIELNFKGYYQKVRHINKK